MLKRDQICKKCGWVSEFIYEIKKVRHNYCANCHSLQKIGPPIASISKNKNISQAEKIDGTGDLMEPLL